MKKLLFLTTLCLTVFCACKKNYQDVDIVRISPDLTIDMLSDSTFFKNVQTLVEYEGDIYMSLDNRMQIIRMDKDLNIKNIIGRQGRGPSEFIYINKFFVENDTIWVGDSGKQALMKFSTDGDFGGSIPRSKGRYALQTRFYVENNKFYFSKIDIADKTSLACLDLNKKEGEDYKKFGELTEFSSDIKTDGQNRRHVFEYNGELISVPRSIPVIEKYDKNTLELKQKFDLSQIKDIDVINKKALEGNTQSNPAAFFILAFDMYVHENLLYIAFAGSVEKTINSENPQQLGIFVFNISDDIKYIKRYMFDGTINCFCVTDDYIYATPTQGGELNRYPLN